MSIPHFTAAWKCREFTGTTRLLLIYLADSASNGKSSDRRHNLKLGFTSKSIRSMMDGINTNRPQTITAALKELRDAGAIKTFRRKRKTAMTFIDINWLQEHAYTPDDNAKRTGGSKELILDSAESAQSTSTPCVDNVYANAKRTIKPTQSALSRGSLTTESVANSQRKAHRESVSSRSEAGRSNTSRIASDVVPPLRGEKRAASLRSKTENQKQPVTRPEPLPLTPEETCPKCGGFWLDCNCNAGTIAKPVAKAEAAFEIEEDLR
jgi:hypothetical protein